MNVIPHSRPDLGEAESQAAADAVRSGFVKGGERRDALERRIAADQGFAAGVATSSCTQALDLALRVLFPGGGARVALSSLVCRSVYDAILNAGCRPVVVDVDPTHLGPSVDAVLAARPDAVVCAHLAGVRAPVEAFAGRVPWIIEDCAQRLLPGDAPVSPRLVRLLSFDATKVITCGEGGMLLLPDEITAAAARHIRAAGYESPAPSIWTGLSDVHAAIASVQWGRLPAMLERRRAIAAQYHAAFPSEAVHPAMSAPGTTFFRFLLKVSDAPMVIAASSKTGVAFRRPVAPMGLHQLFDLPGEFPQAERVLREVLSIPLHSSLTPGEITRVIDATMQLLDIRS